MTLPRKRIIIPAAIVLLVALVVVFWNWDWFIPLAESRASAALGRPVKITHLHVHLARQPTIEADGITIGNPPGFPDAPPLATADKLRVQLDAGAYLRDRRVVIPWIEVEHPVVEARATPDGQDNYTLKLAGSGNSSDASPTSSPQIGDLRITDGHAHVVIPKLRTDFQTEIATREAAAGQPSQIVVDAKGTYANQPITGQFTGGALLSLRDKANPYPVDLKLANGATKITLAGTVEDPLTFAGADLKLNLTGPDMGLLLPLTGVAIPPTPPYSIAGQLDYATGKIRFTNFVGKVGSSDLEGDIEVDPEAQRPKIVANLSSRRVDLADLGGFIGATPGRASTPNQSAAQKQDLARAAASSRAIPDVPINLPKLRAADVELRYKGAKIEGRAMPFDSIATNLTIDDGKVSLHPLALTVGKGSISGNVAIDSQKDVVHTAPTSTSSRST